MASRVAQHVQRTEELLRGVAYWHAQDEDTLREHGAVHISFEGLRDEPTETIGIVVTAYLETRGFHVEWNRSPAQRLRVTGVVTTRRRAIPPGS